MVYILIKYYLLPLLYYWVCCYSKAYRCHSSIRRCMHSSLASSSIT